MNLRIKEPMELDEVGQYFTTFIQEAAWCSRPTPKEEMKKIDNTSFHIRELVTEADGRDQEIMTGLFCNR
jgi:hypothetical protein